MILKNNIYNFFWRNKYVILVAFFFLFGFLFKLYLLSCRSLYIDPDEGYYLILARNLIHGKGYTFNGLLNIIFPPMLPMAIASLSLLTGNLQTSLNIITALSGTLLGLIVYLISRKKFSQPVSLGSYILTLFIYQLNSFLPVAAPYTHNLYRGSDILNCFFIFVSVYFVILIIETNKFLFYILSGIFLSLAYLTRPEGFILFALTIFILILLKMLFLSHLSLRKIICMLLVFFTFSLPYIFYLKSATGQWTLSGKISASQKYRQSLLEVIKKNDWSYFNKIHYSLNKEGTQMNDIYFGYHESSDTEGRLDAISWVEKALENLLLYWIVLKVLLPIHIFPLFVLGIILTLIRCKKRKSYTDFILLILILYSFFIEAISYPIPRHHLFLVPIFIIYSIEGAQYLSSKMVLIMNSSKERLFAIILLILLFFIFNDYLIMSTKNLMNIPEFKAARESEVSISEYLKEKRAEVIMSMHPCFAVRAYSDWQVLPMASLSQMLKFAKYKKVDYVIIPGFMMQERNKVQYYIIRMQNSYVPTNNNYIPNYRVIEKRDAFMLIEMLQ